MWRRLVIINLLRKLWGMNRMTKLWNKIYPSLSISMTVITLLFTFVPESCFLYGIIIVGWPMEIIVICNRFVCFIIISLIIGIAMTVYKSKRTSISITGNGYKIVVEYGDLFKNEGFNKIINFDECYTTHVGNATADVKAESVCGQFLAKYSDTNFTSVIQSSNTKKQRKRSEYNNQECYASGSIVPFEDYLLMAFAKLDKDGRGNMTREEFLSCLDLLWNEIDKYSRMKSVAMPILGSGITRFMDETLSKQQLLDMIIASYKLSPYKLKLPAELHIICCKDDNFSLNKVGKYI